MSDEAVNNKRIAKNTIFLYLRMIVLMVVNLYTVRVVLQVLGETDYGIYNVVGGIVTIFSFLNSTLSTSSQRYFSVELANNDLDKVNKWLCLNITIFLGLAGCVLLLAETIGLWFVNNKMIIPSDRIFSANIVYQISLATFVANMVTVPYNALIIAHEKMSAFAYISIIEAGAKLLVAIILPYILFDHLILYAIFIMLVTFAVASSYIIYCRLNFAESKISYYWNKTEALELFEFSGWHFMGTMSMVLRSQAINILINLFFHPAVNAARAISYQVLSAINQLSANFFTAVKPQIYKSYALGEMDNMRRLIMYTTIISMFLVSLIVFPIIGNTQYILSLWLNEVPDYTVLFTQLVLINGLIDSIGGPTIAAALATGKIKRYEIVVSILIFSNLPISYIALRLGCDPTITVVVSIIVSIITAVARGYMLQSMVALPFKYYLLLLFKLLIITISMGILTISAFYNRATNIIDFLCYAFLSSIAQTFIYYMFALNNNDRILLLNFIRRHLQNDKI